MSRSSPIVKISPLIVAPATPYTDGDVVGGVLAFAAPFGTAKTGIIKSVVVKDAGNQKSKLTLLIFDKLPTGTYTDNAAFAWGTGDFAKCIGRINVADTDYLTVASKAVADVAAAKNAQDNTSTVSYASDTNLWVIPVLNGSTPTYAVGDLEIQLGFLQD